MSLLGILLGVLIFLSAMIALIPSLLFSNGSLTVTYWELLTRDKQIRSSPPYLKSKLVSALISRYFTFISPASTPQKEEAKIELPPTEEFIKTTKELREMIDPDKSWIRMYKFKEKVNIIALKSIKKIENISDRENRHIDPPMIGKLVLFSFPQKILETQYKINNIERIGIKYCWEIQIPGFSTAIAMSSTDDQLAICYRLILPGGFRYRIRYFPKISCDSPIPIISTPLDFALMSINSESYYSNFFDDIALPNNSQYISALTIENNTIAYSASFDALRFHILYKINNEWSELYNMPVVDRSFSLYLICSSLILFKVPNNSSEKMEEFVLLGFSRRGQSLNALSQEITVHRIAVKNNNTIEDISENNTKTAMVKLIYAYTGLEKLKLYFVLADLETPPKKETLFALSEDRKKALIVSGREGVYFIKIMKEIPENSSIGEAIYRHEFEASGVSSNKDFTASACFLERDNSAMFFALNSDGLEDKAKLELSSIPLEKAKDRKGVDMILLDDENITNSSK